ncbi:hypothetical protein DZA28_21360 [Pseudomonas alloputida]|jgi:hypothetical protein|uniref:Uncharacterized protein n=1 Tax=Pseudomonas alloputida TaxID=1940621 RepID=A0ABY3D9J5_9PSED|nr:hypothetical protein [Pseudomonas alloputida]TRZ62352.1 hypothetical protein DZA28_21360 [Pseudomonas alloputida]
MNLAALQHLVNNEPEIIEGNVPAGTDSNATLGVAKFIAADEANLRRLSENQRYHFERFILPLIEHVACEGVFGPEDEDGDGCVGSGFIDDEDLENCYQSGDMFCQECTYVQNKMNED